MKETPIRVAHVIGKWRDGGVEAVVCNYYRHIDRKKIQFDFYVDEDSPHWPSQELIDMGARCFVVPPYQNALKYVFTLVRYFRENQYKIVHSHINSLSTFPLFAAWMAGIPVRICHNHSTAGKGETARNIMKYTLRPFAKVFATDYCACSKYAGEWLFGKHAVNQGKVTIFKNAIELERFRFNSEVRKSVRREFGMDGRFVIGHVGRFCFQKNHDFLVDIFAEVYRQRKDAMLLLTGEGGLLEQVRAKVHKLGLDEAVIFAGQRYDMERLYQAMDVFVLPSRYEGLGIVNIEAQAAGLPCVVSDVVPKEAQVTSSIVFLSLNASVEYWADQVIQCGMKDRTDTVEEIRNCGFAISSEGEKLQKFYSSVVLRDEVQDEKNKGAAP